MPKPRKLRQRLLTATGAVILIATVGFVATESSANQNSADDAPTVPKLTDMVTQVAEPGAKEAPISASGTGSKAAKRELCHDGASWQRFRFTELDLNGEDSLTVTGSEGGTFTFTNRHWPGKAFYSRAFSGECVTVEPKLSDKDSGYEIDAFQYGSKALTKETVTVAGAGDICGDACNQTDDLITNINPASVFTAGDNAYEDGTLDEFQEQYDPTWGAFKDKTRPAPGNHEYHTDGEGYYEYFGDNAGEAGKGYYSYDVGDWHFVAVNSEIDFDPDSEQGQWLADDLASNTKPCTAAYTHHPRFSSGEHGDDSGMDDIFSALYDNQADLFITGHDHHYERFAPAAPDGSQDDDKGLRSFVIGTGGRALYDVPGGSDGPSEVFNNDTFGVGKFDLTATGYSMDFVPVAGRDFTDHVEGGCHKASA
ncbi:metallophosphoesterase family protein [Stackebrandtia nassauensis]|uniref:Alkaline phosphatase n=1 Tax=Stackebrandtia nassauensis (strain DSM 44728 / CIP 108903 / NRRL B-16338 / NBRC 102104 / LLR-40K-21) TaxID=446470 RepID=D3Q2K0_STANL|nr:metallophosphoesterase [Stackebrandtia nassauensis]ADD43933.1 Alkaline phosphatase [Stackebrandtia nassauensis DSM 44728]